MKHIDVRSAVAAYYLRDFLDQAFPDEWKPIAARILDAGAVYSDTDVAFAPRWTPVPRTMRYGRTEEETAFKSMIFRVHDCLHQLWGLSVPRNYTDEAERSHFKRVWMCTEVAVLTITEFFYCQWLYDTQPHLRPMLEHRNTLVFKRTSKLRDMSMTETALVLNAIIHENAAPEWVSENEHGRIFMADYCPMLEQDRVNIDHNWRLLCTAPPASLKDLPNQRYSRDLDGLKLTLWMIRDFTHLLDTDDDVDWPLHDFNAARRARVTMPATWNAPPRE